MIIEVNISCVDSATHYSIKTDDPRTAYEYLKDKDHEGSSIEVKVIGTNEAGYELIRLMKAYSVYTLPFPDLSNK